MLMLLLLETKTNLVSTCALETIREVLYMHKLFRILANQILKKQKHVG